MLSKTRKSSPIRVAAGLAGIGALSIAALGLTASGTQAAEKMKDKMSTAMGVDLGQDMPAPPAPPAEAAAPAPAAPPSAPAPIEGSRHVYRYEQKQDGKQVKKIVVVHADGTQQVSEIPEMRDVRINIPEIPEVRDGNCGTGKGKPTVEHRHEGKKQIMIVCADRIAMVTMDAQRMAQQGRRMGIEGARMGLRQARHSIETAPDMSAEERAKALKGIDEAMAEIDNDRDQD